MTRRGQDATARLGQRLDRLLIGLVWLDPRLMAAYQVTISEAAIARERRPPAVVDVRDSITEPLVAAPGVVA